ncbi:MAG TPA: adenosine deaminase [Bryobacteraceae bacterium]|nr:adenosine deaminase [Bryobacteraceae bacterium]
MPPRAELHLHLEGSIEPETVCEINPRLTVSQARANYRFTDFRGFIQSYIWVNNQLTEPVHYAIATRRCLERLHAHGIRYAEINLSAGVVLWKGQEFGPMFEAAAAAAAENSNLEVRWILDAVRQFGPEHGMRVAELAGERAHRGVVGFGIGGDEARGSARDFRDVFAFARSAGLAVLPHAGETVGPDSVWAALECGARRIGHGFRSIEDPVLVRHLADRQIPLEICLTSNVRTGAVRSLAEHPVRRLYDAGVPITLNTDDPAMFETTLAREFELARDAFGFSETELQEIGANADRFAVRGREVC